MGKTQQERQIKYSTTKQKAEKNAQKFPLLPTFCTPLSSNPGVPVSSWVMFWSTAVRTIPEPGWHCFDCLLSSRFLGSSTEWGQQKCYRLCFHLCQWAGKHWQFPYCLCTLESKRLTASAAQKAGCFIHNLLSGSTRPIQFYRNNLHYLLGFMRPHFFSANESISATGSISSPRSRAQN